jgi:hypothetical protein
MYWRWTRISCLLMNDGFRGIGVIDGCNMRNRFGLGLPLDLGLFTGFVNLEPIHESGRVFVQRLLL